MGHPVADILLEAARTCRDDPRRDGNVLHFDAGERMIVCGDLHGNRPNLAKVISHADLKSSDSRVLILQELLHGGPTDAEGGCRSFEILLRAARLKNQHPRAVYFLLSNHDVTELTDGEITKNGVGKIKALRAGLANAYGADADEVVEAMKHLLLSLPLLAQCGNGVAISHSLPSPGREDRFKLDVLRRPYRREDFRRGGAVYEFVWGRRHSAASLETMAAMLDAEAFVNGHQPQLDGFLVNKRQLILASEHPCGAIAEFDADEPVDPELLDTLVRRISAL